MEEVGSRTGPNTTSEESLETVEEVAQQNDTVHGERRRWTRWLPSIFLGLALLSGVSGTAYWLLDRPSSNTVEIFLPTATPMSAPVAHVSGAVVAPGAGFVDTAVYQNIFTKKPKPTWWEQKLWHLYDVPPIAANFFNPPIVAYSGDIDKQKEYEKKLKDLDEGT